MLSIIVHATPDREFYVESENSFVTVKGLERDCVLNLEHSLLSLSKWESKWHKPFLSRDTKTTEETIDYVKCMTLNKNIDPRVYDFINNDHIQRINAYIEDPMTATTFSNRKKGGGREIVTSELIYYWMIALTIPVEFEKWHLNRLITLIEICNIKNNPDKHKMSKSEMMNKRAALNAARRKQLHSKG